MGNPNGHPLNYEVRVLTEQGWVTVFTDRRARALSYAKYLRKYRRKTGQPVRGRVKVV